MPTLSRRVAAALCISLTFVVLVACAPEVPAPATTATTSAASPSPSTVASPEPTTPTASEPADCATVLDDEGNADLTDTGYEPFDYSVVGGRDFPLLEEFFSDGVVCAWAVPQSDVYIAVGQLPMAEERWATARAELEAIGFSTGESDGIVDYVVMPFTDETSYPWRGFAWRDGLLFYASYPGILHSVPAFQS